MRRARGLLRRAGDELRLARVGAGLSLRTVATAAGLSRTHVWRIERAEAPHVDLDALARIAEVVGCDLSLGVHPVSTPVRDRAHLALIARFRGRLHPAITVRTEVPMPIPGDRRTADLSIHGVGWGAVVEAETRLGDAQATVRRLSLKARDLGTGRMILLVLDSRHDREVIARTPALSERFPIGTRAAMAALARGEDPGGDSLIVL